MTGSGIVEYDPDEGVAYVRLSEAEISWTKSVDDSRLVDYAADGAVVGIEFLDVVDGIDLTGLPMRDRVEPLVRANGIPVRATTST